ncbi:MAG: hypothetical protein IPJ85_18180 [Flavobacteriales bacterium]|nr:hypothetical protein [Flavobacteriales bacterium]
MPFPPRIHSTFTISPGWCALDQFGQMRWSLHLSIVDFNDDVAMHQTERCGRAFR